MLKRLVLILAAVVFVAVIGVAVVLVGTHIAVRREAAPLPPLEAIDAVAGVGALVDDAPIRLSMINTASQKMARAMVLDPKRDPHGERPFEMSYPAFALEWKDGRILLVDAGMTRAGAEAFGATLERVGAAEKMHPHRSVADALGEAAPRVKGVVFTHLHTDHVGGITELCTRLNVLRAPMTEAQAEHTNYTTRPGLDRLEDADCIRFERVHGGPLFPVQGFPGVFVIDAGGHTPGSQIILAFVHDADGSAHRYAFTGDIVNNIDGITYDVPKPFFYRTFIVPEADGRQHDLRVFLKRLHDDAGFALLVSHDQLSLAASGVPPWNGSAPP